MFSRTITNRLPLQVVCAVGAAAVGLIYLFYYGVNGFYDMSVDASSLDTGFLIFITIVGLLSLVGAIGYWLGKTWGWVIHLVSVLGQLLFPGSLFEFKLDLYHMIGWLGPILSLAIVIVMGAHIRRRRKQHA